MSNRFYKVGWDVEHLLNVFSETLGALVVILLHGTSSTRMSFSNGLDPIIAILDATTSKQQQAKEQSNH
jgi:hypothetical protein